MRLVRPEHAGGDSRLEIAHAAPLPVWGAQIRCVSAKTADFQVRPDFDTTHMIQSLAVPQTT